MKYINPSCTTVINLYQHTWLLIEKPSFKLANTPSSTCFPSPNITNLSKSSTETAKGMNKWETFSRQAKQDTILLRDTSPSCKPCRPSSCFIMLSDSNRTQPNNPSFMSPKHPLLSWNSLRAGTWKDCPCWGTWQSTHAVDLSFMLAKSFGSWGTIRAALVGGYLKHFSLKRSKNPISHACKTEFQIKWKIWGLTAPNALSLKRKYITREDPLLRAITPSCCIWHSAFKTTGAELTLLIVQLENPQQD